MYTLKTLTSEPEIFLDPNQFSKDGKISLNVYEFSECGRYLAYGFNKSGSDWTTIRVLDVETRENLTDRLEWVKFSEISWTHDHLGFFYNRYLGQHNFDQAGTETDSNINQKVYYHKLGTSQDQDILVYERLDQPQLMFACQVSRDGQYIFLMQQEGCENRNLLSYAKLNQGHCEASPDFIYLVTNWEAEYSYLHNVGTVTYFRTN